MESQTAFLTFAATIAERDAAGLPKRFEGVAYSGGVIPNYGWYGDAAIDLASLRLPDGEIFALVDHEPSQRAGKLTATLADNQLRISGEFFASSPAGQEVAALFAEGAPWQLSVGIQAKAKSSDDKSTVTVNGQSLQVNTLFTDASLREVSFVPVGADPSTSAVAFARGATPPAPSPGASSSQTQDATMTLEELTARVAELETQVGAERARADAAEATLREQAVQARAAAITALAAEVNKEFSEAERTTFAALDEATFATVANALRAMKPAAPEHLFREQATGGAAPQDDAQRAAKARQKMFNQVGGKAA